MGDAAFGTVFTIGLDTVAALTNISGPSLTADVLDTSSHDSWRNHPVIDTCTFDNLQNVVESVGHGLANGTLIRFSSDGDLPAELSDDVKYYVVNTDVDEFQVSLTLGGAPVAFTDDGDPGLGDHYYHYATAHREFVAGILNGGDVTVEGNLTILSAADVFKALLDSRDEENMSIVLPTTPAVTWSFKGVITAYSNTAPYEDKLGFTATIKVTEQPELT